jgi:UDP-2-acetamido-2,6-beta-L-arabino-hexul-4-ose reductase
LVSNLVHALDSTQKIPHVIFSSSSQEERDNLYGASKREGRELLANWSKRTGSSFTGMIIPNVFGPFGNPFYNSFIATFSHQLANGDNPTIEVDGEVKLIYIDELIRVFLEIIRSKSNDSLMKVSHTATYKVSDILNKLKSYQEEYFQKGIIATLNNSFDLNLFNTFRSYLNHSDHFPVQYVKHSDARGSFVEIIRLNVGGQVSFSTTLPGITRGNHYHTRKIERFSVIRGKALIQLRKIGTSKILEFVLDGNEPSYVDMPIWYTHNIKNIGEEELYTNFWINEFYDPKDPDTYFENV